MTTQGTSEGMPVSPDAPKMAVRAFLTGSVSDGAMEQLAISVQKFADSLCDKAREIEQRQRASGVDNAEYTASTIIKAFEELAPRDVGKKDTKFDLTLKVIAPLSAAAAGVFGSYLHSNWQSGTFGALSLLAVVTTIGMVWRGRTR